MKKRFTDTDKWETTWFTDLNQEYKLLWLYILDKCDHIGQWIVNLKLANFHLGEKFELQDIKEVFDGKFIPIEDGDIWLIPDNYLNICGIFVTGMPFFICLEFNIHNAACT